MRRLMMAAAATLLALGGPVRVEAQASGAQPSSAARDSFAQALEQQRATPAGKSLPTADRFSWGNLSIPAGSTVDGPVAAAHGTVDVQGRVVGDVFAIGGDIVVHAGGEVTGDARALQGKVIIDGGRVGGEKQAALPLAGKRATAPALTGTAAVQHALKLSLAWFTVLLLVGIGVIIFSGAQLEGVVQALEHRFTVALFIGIASQLGALPVLALLCVGLALTLVGVLLIPFAIVAFVLAAAGMITLGVLAAATVAGHAVVRSGPNVRTRSVQSMVLGTVMLFLPWVAVSLLVNTTWAEMLARLVAVAVTWVAASAGLGAAMMARGGVRRVHVHMAGAEVSSSGWQTPTPIGGVIAARRPSATPSQPTGSPR